MSTTPLSAREGYMQNISGEDSAPDDSGPSDTALDSAISDSMAKFMGDAEHIADAITDRTKIRERDDEPLPVVEGEGWANLVSDPDREAPAPREAGLEKILRDRELAVAKREVASKEFRDAKPWRDEAKRIGVTPAQLLEGFLGWDNKFDADPVAAADAFAAAGFKLPLHMIDDAPEKDGKSPNDEYSDPLDKVIAKAIRGDARRDQEEFAPTAEQWKKIQAKYPGESLDSVMRRGIEILKDLNKSPWETAARVAAAKGMPVTPASQQAAAVEYQAQAEVRSTIEQAKQYLPGLRDAAFSREVGTVMSQANFVPSGNDAYDIERAYQVVEIQRQQPDNIRATIDHYAPSQPDYAEVRPYVEAVLRKDRNFTFNTNVDAERVWAIARTVQQNHQGQQQKKLKTLDGRINAAMAQHGVAA